MYCRLRALKALLLAASLLVSPSVKALEKLDSTILPVSEHMLGPVAIDPAGEFAYVASHGHHFYPPNTYRGTIIKYDLTTFERVDQLFIDIDMSQHLRHFQTGFVDPDGNYAYFGNVMEDTTSIVKIDLQTFEKVDILQSEWPHFWYLDSAVDPEGTYAYFLSAFGWVEKIDLTTFEQADIFEMEDDRARSLAIDPDGEYLYIGTREIDPPADDEERLPVPGKFIKLDLANFEAVDYFELEDHFDIDDVAVHPSGEFAYFRSENQLITVETETFEPVSMHTIGSTQYAYGNTLVADLSGDYLYYHSSGTWSRFDLNTEQSTGSISGMSVFVDIDPSGQFLYSPIPDSHEGKGFGKIDLDSLEILDTISYEDGIYSIEAATIDPSGEFGYFGGQTVDLSSIATQHPQESRLVKLDLASMEMVDDITLPGGSRDFTSAIMDFDGEFAYLTRRNSPATVHRLDVANFEWAGSVSFSGLQGFLASVISPDGSHAYFIEGSGRIARLNLDTFEPAGVIETNQSVLMTAAIDPDGRYLYSSTWPDGHLVKVDVQSMTLIDVMSEVGLGSPMIIDAAGEFGYLGTGGPLYKFDLDSFEIIEWINAPMVNGIIDPSGNYLYQVNGNTVRRVDLDAFQVVESTQVTVGQATLYTALMHPDGHIMWAGTRTHEALGEPSRIVKIGVLRSAQLEHTAVAINGQTPQPFAFDQTGDVIEFITTIENDGNVTLMDVNAVEPQFDEMECMPEVPAIIEPGSAMVCTGLYSVTQADLDAGGFHSDFTADINRMDPLNASAHVAAIQSPDIVLDAAIIEGDDFTTVGESINFLLTAINSGNVTLSDVVISDPDESFADCDPVPGTGIGPGDSMSCEGSHVVTQADLDAGHFTIAASVTALVPDSSQIEADGSATASAVQSSSLTLVKQAGVEAFHSVGEVIEFSIVASNDGNVSLTEVMVADEQLDSLDCEPDIPADLAPANAITCTGSHAGTEENVMVGSITNIAVANSNQTEPVEATEVVLLTDDLLVSLAPTTVDFGPIDIGADSSTTTAVLTNTGSGDVGFQGISDPHPAFVVQGGTCLPPPTIIAVDGSCTITVMFSPNEPGDFSDSLTIHTNMPGSPQSIELTGTGFGTAMPTPITVPVNSRWSLLVLLLVVGLTGWRVLHPRLQ